MVFVVGRVTAFVAGLSVAAGLVAALAGALGVSFCTLAFKASMRAISALMSLADGTPILLSTLATRSSKMLSSLSHWPDALLEMSVAKFVTFWAASLIFSPAADWVLRWKLTPSLTRASKALLPSVWAWVKAPKPACQMCCAESLTEWLKVLPDFLAFAFVPGVVFLRWLL